MMMINCSVEWFTDESLLSFISSQDQLRMFSLLQNSDTPREGFELAQNLSSDS